MATLDVTNVRVISFAVDTTVTAFDGNDYTAIANLRYGIPYGATSLTVGGAGAVMCQLKAPRSAVGNELVQVFTVDEVRTPV